MKKIVVIFLVIIVVIVIVHLMIAKASDSFRLPTWTISKDWYIESRVGEIIGSYDWIILWGERFHDHEGVFYRILGQRIDKTGMAKWKDQEVSICTEIVSQPTFTVIDDGFNGTIVFWSSGSPWRTVCGQRIDKDGISRWHLEGTIIFSVVCYYEAIRDGKGGAIILANLANIGIFVKRVNEHGEEVWKNNYTLVGNAIAIADGVEDATPHMTGDDLNGAIIVWKEFRNKDKSWDIYAQRIDGDGNKKWIADGVPICVSPFKEENPQIISDGSGGAIITWYNSLPRMIGGFGMVYAQRIDRTGEVIWAKNGIVVSKAKEPLNISKFQQYDPVIVSDGLGGAIIAWRDMRNGNHSDIYAQRVDSNGEFMWDADGVPICTMGGDTLIQNITNDGSGGAIITWVDKQRNGIYAQRINNAGEIMSKDNGIDIFSTIHLPQNYRDGLRINYRNNNYGGLSVMWREAEIKYEEGLYLYKFYLENIPLNTDKY